METMQKLNPVLLSTRQVARRLKVATSTVTRMAHSGQLSPATKAPGIRGAMMFDPADVDALAREKRATSEEVTR